MGTLSVRENLAFSAALRLPMSTTRKERADKVESVISELGLSHVAKTKVSVCVCVLHSVVCVYLCVSLCGCARVCVDFMLCNILAAS